jgi:hypothetical protein
LSIGHAGVVDEDLEPARRFDDSGNGGGGGVDVSDVEGDRLGLAAGVGDRRDSRLRGRRVADVTDVGPRAERRQMLGDAPADAARRPGDEGDLVGQRTAHLVVATRLSC